MRCGQDDMNAWLVVPAVWSRVGDADAGVVGDHPSGHILIWSAVRP